MPILILTAKAEETDQVVGFARFEGRTVGVLASDSRHPNGGAMTADGCSKLIRHLDLCDLFHIPILNLVDKCEPANLARLQSSVQEERQQLAFNDRRKVQCHRCASGANELRRRRRRTRPHENTKPSPLRSSKRVV